MSACSRCALNECPEAYYRRFCYTAEQALAIWAAVDRVKAATAGAGVTTDQPPTRWSCHCPAGGVAEDRCNNPCRVRPYEAAAEVNGDVPCEPMPPSSACFPVLRPFNTVGLDHPAASQVSSALR